MKNRIFSLTAVMLAVTIFCGCSSSDRNSRLNSNTLSTVQAQESPGTKNSDSYFVNNSYSLNPDNISEIWMETRPTSASYKHTYDKELITDIVQHINGLKLRERKEKDEDIVGMSYIIEITETDGTKKVFSEFGPYFYELGTDYTNEYVIKNQKDTLSKIYGKMDTAPSVKGVVEKIDISERNENELRLLIAAESEGTATPSIIGDKGYVSIKADEIYKNSAPYEDICVGDELELFIIGGIAESYPTQSHAYKANVIGTGVISTGINPYYVLFDELYSSDSGLNSKIKCIAIDMDNCKADTEYINHFISLMQYFCKVNDLTLLEDNYAGLLEKGMITDYYFEDGIIISFKDNSFSDTKLVSSISKWRSGLGAIGGDYTVKNNGGIWEITNADRLWIS